MNEELINQLENIIKNDLPSNLPPILPGEKVAESLINAVIMEKAGKKTRITFNEIESLFYSVNLLAVSNAFHSFQAKDRTIDEFSYKMPGVDDYGIFSGLLARVMSADGFVDYAFVLFWDNYCSDIDAHPQKDDSILLEYLRDVIPYVYKVLFVRNLETISNIRSTHVP